MCEWEAGARPVFRFKGDSPQKDGTDKRVHATIPPPLHGALYVFGFDLFGFGSYGSGTRFGAQPKIGLSTGTWIPNFTFDVNSDWSRIITSDLFKAADAYRITTSADLPGSTHWDPAPVVPVGGPGGGGGGGEPGVIDWTPGGLPTMVLGYLPDVIIEDQPNIIFNPVPVLLPGQVDPGREEQETEDEEVAHTWSHFAGNVFDTLFGGGQLTPGVNPGNFNLSGPTGTGGGTGGGGGGGIPVTVPNMGECPAPRKYCIDTATGKVTPYRRRRRRKLLTEGDMHVLFQIATLPNNANVRTALSRAVRR